MWLLKIEGEEPESIDVLGDQSNNLRRCPQGMSKQGSTASRMLSTAKDAQWPS